VKRDILLYQQTYVVLLPQAAPPPFVVRLGWFQQPTDIQEWRLWTDPFVPQPVRVAAGGPLQTFTPAPVVLTLVIPEPTISRTYPGGKDYLPLLRSPHPVK